MKTRLLLCKGLIAVLTAAVCATVSFGQIDRAKEDLRRSFRKFDLQRVDTAPGVGEGHRSLKVKVGARDVQIEVESHDIRSARYRSEDSASPGDRRAADTDIKTFKGVVAGEDGSSVRLTIDN